MTQLRNCRSVSATTSTSNAVDEHACAVDPLSRPHCPLRRLLGPRKVQGSRPQTMRVPRACTCVPFTSPNRQGYKGFRLRPQFAPAPVLTPSSPTGRSEGAPRGVNLHAKVLTPSRPNGPLRRSTSRSSDPKPTKLASSGSNERIRMLRRRPPALPPTPRYHLP